MLVARDFECDACGIIVERFCDHTEEMFHCSGCDIGMMHKIFTPGSVYCGNQDATWLKDVREVVNKDGGPAAKEFLKNPTRENRKKWMKEEGIRPLETGERLYPERPDTRKVQDDVIRRSLNRISESRYRRYNKQLRKEGGRLNY